MLCKRCNKRMAVVFVSRMEGDKQTNEGYCLKCAKDLGIQQVDQIIKNMGLTDEDLDTMSEEMEALNDQLGIFPTDMDSQTTPTFPSMFSGMFGGHSEEKAPPKAGKKENGKKRKFLEQYATNLNRKAKEGKLDPVIGRKAEIDRMIRILNRRTKNNPVLIGEPGVGKTAVANALAQKIVAEDVPAKLLNKEVYLLDLTALVAGTQFRGQFESRIKGLISEVVELGNIILVIDEVHNLVGTGESEGSMNAANILKPALANGEIQVIGATTLSEYRKYIEKDAALERRFQPIIVDEPSVEETVEILKGLRDVYGAYHHVHISDALLTTAAVMSERYITDRFLPDKAIDLIDEASSGAAIENVSQNQKFKLQFELAAVRSKLGALDSEDEKMFEKSAELKAEQCRIEEQLKALSDVPEVTELTFDHIAYVLELWTGIPAAKIKEQEFVKLQELGDKLRSRIIGQEEAITALTAAIKRRRVGIGYNRSPISFIFTGPTGVGKTELVRQLSLQLFDSYESLIRVDMSEYMEKHSVSKLIGAPPGYVGYDDAGQLTEKIRRKPYSVILFDEIEKAHPDVLNIMLQMLDDGKLTDAQGRVVNFENTIIIMTTNASAGMMNTTGFNRGQQDLEKEKSTKALLTFLRPEFVNRIDEIITFAPLSKETANKIARIMLGDLAESLKDREIELNYDDAVVEYLVDHGFDAKFGARSLKRTIQKELEDKAAEQIITHFDSKISTLTASVQNGELSVCAG